MKLIVENEHPWMLEVMGEVFSDVKYQRCTGYFYCSIFSSNVVVRLNREMRYRLHMKEPFPDGNSALMLVCARRHHVAGVVHEATTSIGGGF